MAQLFSNNVDTQLSAPLTDVGTSATLADGSGLNTPTGGDYELLTLIDGATVEIVSMTARTGNTITIARAQEGTTAVAWGTGARVFAGVTAGTLEALSGGLVDSSDQATTLNIGGSQGTGVTNSVLLGKTAYLGNSRIDAVLVGFNASGESSEIVAVGKWAYAVSANSIAIGALAETYGSSTGAVAIGAPAIGRGLGAIAIGQDAYSWGDGAISIGSSAEAQADGAVAIGGFTLTTPHVFCVEALPAARKGGTEAGAAWEMSAAQSVILSDVLDLKTLQTYTIPMPTGVTFYPDEVGVIVTAADTVSGQPTLQFGITGTADKYLAATATTGLAAARDRERFATLASDGGATTLRAEITVAATGTTLSGRVYWKGAAVID